jgi:hypothetical protein
MLMTQLSVWSVKTTKDEISPCNTRVIVCVLILDVRYLATGTSVISSLLYVWWLPLHLLVGTAIANRHLCHRLGSQSIDRMANRVDCPQQGTNCLSSSHQSLPESGPLPSAFYRALSKEDFAERRPRQSPALGKEVAYRVQDTQHNEALGKDGSRQRAVSGRLQLTAVSLCRGPKADTRQSRFFAECQITGTR